ncbi:hypothetical protein Bbelb_283460 [Branchiostoma belcheri]|nr:hypothetical protein Bbelb_283460 [Branchiostoma belcheri]
METRWPHYTETLEEELRLSQAWAQRSSQGRYLTCSEGGVPPIYGCVCVDTTTGSTDLQTLTALWSLRDRGNAVGPWQAWPLVWFENVIRASRARPQPGPDLVRISSQVRAKRGETQEIMSGAPEVFMMSDTVDNVGQFWVWMEDGKVALVNDGDDLGSKDVWLRVYASQFLGFRANTRNM